MTTLPELVVSGTPTTASVAPATLNLATSASSGSRLGLSPLGTPASIEVLRGETVRERGDLNINDAVSRATGITSVASPGDGNTALVSRGFVGPNSVMRLFDGTQMYVGAGTVTFPFDTWTVDRIEVLRGPASVLYGQGAIGGAINVVSRQPNPLERRNEAEILFDTNLTQRLGLASSGPVNEWISYNLAVAGDMSDGWVDRGRSGSLSISGALRFQVTPQLAVTVSHDYGMQQPARYLGLPLVEGRLLNSLRTKNYNIANPVIRFDDNWTQVRAEWRPNDNLVVRNTAYHLSSHRHWRNAEGYEYQPASRLVNRFDYIEILHDQEQYGNRLDASLRRSLFGLDNTLTIGTDVNRVTFGRTSNSPYGGSSDVPLTGFDPGRFINLASTYPRESSTTDQVSVFAEDRLALTPKVALVTGVRFDSIHLTRRDLVQRTSYERSFNQPSGRAGLVYQPVADVSLYAQFSAASDPVGSLLTLSPAQRDFDLAFGRQVEVGVKQVLWNGRAEWTLAAYEIVKQGLLSNNTSNPDLVQQVGQQSSRGVELAAAADLGRGVRINTNGTVLQARYDRFTGNSNGMAVSYAGKVPVQVPQVSANLWMSWNFAPGWDAQAGVRFVGQAYTDYANTQTRAGYTVVNLGLNWQPHPSLGFSARVQNAFNETYATTYYDGGYLLGPPLTAQFAMRVRF